MAGVVVHIPLTIYLVLTGLFRLIQRCAGLLIPTRELATQEISMEFLNIPTAHVGAFFDKRKGVIVVPIALGLNCCVYPDLLFIGDGIVNHFFCLSQEKSPSVLELIQIGRSAAQQIGAEARTISQHLKTQFSNESCRVNRLLYLVLHAVLVYRPR